MADVSTYIAAAISLNIARGGNSRFLECTDLSSLKRVFFEIYNVSVPDEIMELAASHLSQVGAAMLVKDPYTKDYFSIDERANDNFFNSQSDVATTFGRANRLGADWITEALLNISKIEFGEDRFEGMESAAGIPAADRYVSLSDNSDARDDFVDKLTELTRRVVETNDPDKVMPDRERVLAELRGGVELLRAPKARVRALWVVLGPALLFLSAAFGESLVGSLAADLYTSLKALLGL